jgi:hypothetical protein
MAETLAMFPVLDKRGRQSDKNLFAMKSGALFTLHDQYL